MPKVIVKIGDRYGEWSTVVDAPVTHLVPLAEFRAYYEAEYGRSSMDELVRRLERVEAKGTSSQLDDSAEDLMSLNRFGPREGRMTVKAVIEKWNRESDEYAKTKEPK